MKQKINYESPHMEIVETSLENNILVGSEVYILGSTFEGPDNITNFVDSGIDQAW